MSGLLAWIHIEYWRAGKTIDCSDSCNLCEVFCFTLASPKAKSKKGKLVRIRGEVTHSSYGRLKLLLLKRNIKPPQTRVPPGRQDTLTSRRLLQRGPFSCRTRPQHSIYVSSKPRRAHAALWLHSREQGVRIWVQPQIMWRGSRLLQSVLVVYEFGFKIQYENLIQGQLSVCSGQLGGCTREPSNSTSFKSAPSSRPRQLA